MKFAISNFEIIVIAPAGVRTVGLDHPFYMDICRALQSGDDATVLTLLDARAGYAKVYEKISPGSVEVRDAPDGENPDIYLDGLKITGKVADMIVRFRQKGIPIQALRNFWAKVQKNPLLVGKESLLEFITANQVPLLPNGNFLAYKGVQATDREGVFRSSHDASFLYTIGQPAYLPREQCTMDVHSACGPGLHVGGFQHAGGYGNTMIDCEVDPSDVVSVPSAESVKLRACKLLPIRVNPDRKFYAVEYLDLSKETSVTNHPLQKDDVTEPVVNSVRVNTKKPGNKKTTWYKLVGKRVVSLRKIVRPGPEWLNIRPMAAVPGKAVSKPVQVLKMKALMKMRTWYRKQPNGRVVTLRAVTKPGGGYSSHKLV